MDKYIGRLLDNRYEILEVIGTGGMAVVYKARCHRLNRLVAIKVLKDDFLGDEEFRERFHGESQAVAMLSHPNIVAVYDVSTSVSGDMDYIVMELIEGITLKQYMEKKGVLNWKETLHFAIQIAKALEHAHSRGVVHRDIKPHNVMVLKNGAVKVADFGIARMMSEGNTLTKEALGSVHYISPEQAKGGRVDNRSDIYSLGVVMYEMMAGRPPYEGESPVSVAIQHINGGAVAPSTLNPNIPRGMEQIILRAMAHDMEHRYVSATQMLTDMDEFRKDPAIVFNFTNPALDEAMRLRKPVLVLDPPERKPDRTGATGRTPVAKPPQRKIRQADKKTSGQQPSKKPAKASPVAIAAIVVCTLLIIAMLGALIWTVIDNVSSGWKQMIDVPTLKGKYYDQLPAYNGLEIVIAEEVYHESYEEGKIISQDVASGTKVEEGTVIKITVSLGQEPTDLEYKMPDLGGKTREQAENELKTLKETLDIKVTVTEISSSASMKGKVVGTAPIAGAAMKQGMSVTIQIGNGQTEPIEVMMPALVTLSQEEAIYELGKQGFPAPKITIVESDEPAGTVIYQSVASGTYVMNDTVIVLEVSGTPDQGQDGPMTMAMPLLIGKDVESAKLLLKDKGFSAEPVINEVYNNKAAGTVVGQNPSANGLVSTESVVVLEVSKGPKPVETTPPTPAPTPAPTPVPTPEPTPEPSQEEPPVDTIE